MEDEGQERKTNERTRGRRGVYEEENEKKMKDRRGLEEGKEQETEWRTKVRRARE